MLWVGTDKIHNSGWVENNIQCYNRVRVYQLWWNCYGDGARFYLGNIFRTNGAEKLKSLWRWHENVFNLKCFQIPSTMQDYVSIIHISR